MDAVYCRVNIRKRRACAGLRTYLGYTKIFQGKKFTKNYVVSTGSGQLILRDLDSVRFANLTQRF